MDDTLNHLIRRAGSDPAASREALFRQLLGTATYVLNVGAPGGPEMGVRVTRSTESVSLWADQDPVLGGVWVPLFTSPERVSEYIAARGVAAPSGQEFYWMGHEPGRVYGILQGVGCFAGIRLDPGAGPGVGVSWPEVNALSEGRVPGAAPFLYELPIETLPLPAGTKLRVGPMDPAVTGKTGAQAFFDGAAECESEDFRRLVGLRLSVGQTELAWMPCRHFAATLRRWLERDRRKAGVYADVLVRCLMGFEMYGDAEAMCEWLAGQDGNEAYAWVFLSAIYGRTGRLDSCAQLCEKGIWKYSNERAFYLNQARAYAQLDDRLAAQEAARRGLAHFPGDAALLRFL